MDVWCFPERKTEMKKKKKKKKKLYLTPNVQYFTYQVHNWILSKVHTMFTYICKYMHIHLYIYIHHQYKNNIILIYFGVGDFY